MDDDSIAVNVQIFAALGEATRFSIFERLMREGELSVGDIAADHDLSSPTISKHLRVLEEAGLMRRRIDRQRRMISINPMALNAVRSFGGAE